MQSAYQLMIINVCNVLLNELWHCTHTIATTATNTRYARLGANEQAADCPRSVQFPVGFHLADRHFEQSADNPREVRGLSVKSEPAFSSCSHQRVTTRHNRRLKTIETLPSGDVET